jgi:hypothetical protein
VLQRDKAYARDYFATPCGGAMAKKNDERIEAFEDRFRQSMRCGKERPFGVRFCERPECLPSSRLLTRLWLGSAAALLALTSGCSTTTSTTRTQAPAPAPPLAAPESRKLRLYAPPPTAVLTQRYDNSRAGANTAEHILTTQAVASSEFQLLYSVAVPGQLYAQPLLAPQVTFPDGSLQNLLIVATMANTVAAFAVDDAIYGPAFTPKPVWSTSIGPAVPANFMPMAYTTWTCNPLINVVAGGLGGAAGGSWLGPLGGLIGGAVGSLIPNGQYCDTTARQAVREADQAPTTIDGQLNR